MEALITVLYTFLFIGVIYKWKFLHVSGISQHWVAIGFALKVLAGVGVFLVYTHYYPNRARADIFKFFDDSKVLYDTLWHAPEDFFRMIFSVGNDNPHFDTYYSQMNNWYREFESNLYNDSHTIIRINALMRMFSFGYYNVHGVFMNFLSLIGLVALYRGIYPIIKTTPKLLFAVLFLIPSVVFWGSGTLKEGILLFAIGLLIFYIFTWLRNEFHWLGIPILAFCLILLFHLKFYVLMALIPGLIAFIWVSKTGEKGVLFKYATTFTTFAIAGLNLHHLDRRFNIIYLIVRKQKDFVGLAEFEKSGSTFSITPLEENVLSFILSAPEAFLNTLLRPHLLEISNLMMGLAAVENLVVIGILLFTLFFIKSVKNIPWNLVAFATVFVLLLFIVIGWTTPVLGAMVRYKVPALPFLMLIPLLLIDFDKVLKTFTLLRTSKK